MSRAAPADEGINLNDELPDARLFIIEIDQEGSEIANYLQTGELPMGWTMKKKRALIM